MRVQGSWYCRVGHGHLDKPDHDGGDSARLLGDMNSMGVEDLERRLRGLRTAGGKGNDDDVRWGGSIAPGGGFDRAGWSMDDLGEDLLYHVASYLPTLSDLSSLCSTSGRARRLLYGGGGEEGNARRSEDLLRGVFLRAFGSGGGGTASSWGGDALEQPDLSFRERWAAIRGLRWGLVRGSIVSPPPPLPPNDDNDNDLLLLRDTIGVLPEHDEGEAIYYDNPSRVTDIDAAYCNGYFGMCALRLPQPPNAGINWRPPIVVRGDFDGIRILGSTMSMFQCRRRQEPPIGGGGDEGDDGRGGGGGGDVCVVGDDDGGGQVLSLIHCDPSSMRAASPSAGDGRRNPPPCCFIGYASGRVAAVTATLTPESDGYAFAISGTHHAHESEVTDLTFVDCGMSPRDGGAPVLFSACCAGKVYFYPHAYDPDENFSMERSVLAFSNFYNCPIFSMVNILLSNVVVLSPPCLYWFDHSSFIVKHPCPPPR
jgi:hypothetical protein